MKSVTVSAPGKLMLFGEYAVLNNKPCIVTAVSDRMRIKISTLKEERFKLEAPDVGLKDYSKPMTNVGEGIVPKEAQFVEAALKIFIKKYPLKKGVSIQTKSQFSSRVGLGSSSATAVCVIAALMTLCNKKISKKQLFKLTYSAVLEVQGTSSGFDVACAIYGGTLYFVKGGKVIKPLSIEKLPLTVIYSGKKADTISMIKKVEHKFFKHPTKLKATYDAIAKITEDAKKTLLKKEWLKCGDLMNENQNLLQSLGVSTKKINNIISHVLEAGAYGAKISGAGGGDCIIALVPSSKNQFVQKAVTKTGAQVLEVSVGAPGITIEKYA